ncbi:thiamine pyrophosphate-binding protein [Shewanella sp. C32]|uniref:Thiamine pyrophosphate-binding protein n=1 Tax=Shewanella electrica TaxID=515560 RepID=A0ABT2FJB2_9GAMM|nr:thiamine pyrophosphate-binding protein [Shewanella electrica]MCH1924522.1 thiamine pyrophosphate-binding protein [Shewanella electrica]MCS4556423.1 thiamine pyrophosphate-binding protein [Shewanella electrica]
MTQPTINVAADAVIAFLAQQGHTSLHNFPGGTIAPLLDACGRFGVKVYTSKNEQGAGYAAFAQAKISGLPGLVAVTSGPGVTNVLTPVCDAYYDSVPMLVFTGQVGVGDLRGDKPVRQYGFQEVDTPALMASITKAQFQPHTVEELVDALPKAWAIAVEGRPGPVSIDLPMSVQRSAYSQVISPIKAAVQSPDSDACYQFLDELNTAIKHATKPLIICGNGMATASRSQQLARIRQQWRAPISHSLLGVGVADSADSGTLGYHGHTGSQISGNAIADADLILVLGSRLDIRQTGTLRETFGPHAKIFRVDFDEGELSCSKIRHDAVLLCDLDNFLALWQTQPPMVSENHLDSWYQQIEAWREQYPWPYPHAYGLRPNTVVERLSDLFPANTIVTTGVGAHQHWVARHFRFALPNRRLFTSAGHGAMGFDLPTAIGAAIHAPDSCVLCFVGDGSFQMNIQELAMIRELNLNIKIVVVDNHRLALVSQFQLMNWDTDTACGHKQSPDFVTIAKGYGIDALHCGNGDDFDDISQQFANHNGPMLLHLELDERHDVLPMLLGGQAINKMWPFYDMQGQARELSDD